MNKHHAEILGLIKEKSGKGTQHTDLDSYLGNSHPRYAITLPVLRSIAKEWMKAHKDMSAKELSVTMTSLVKGESATEKMMVGILLDNATKEQKQFDPMLFDKWLDHLVGWAEVDTVCTGKYCITEIPENLSVWKKILTSLSKSDNINKRRASLVFMVSTLSQNDDSEIGKMALAIVDRLKHEKEIIITRAVSWVLRSMIRHYRKTLEDYLKKNEKSLPSIAVRETKVKLATGTKGG